MFSLFNARFIYENKLPSAQPESHDNTQEKLERVTSFLGFEDMILSVEKGEKPRFDRAETFLE